MNSQFKGLSTLPIIGSLSTLFLILTSVKVSYIFGSYSSFFSVSDVLMPLAGNLGMGFVSFIVLLRLGLKATLTGASLWALVYHIPGICASAYWASNRKVIGLVIPILSMIAFIAHPVGYYAVPYTFYWFIPMILFFIPQRSIFLDALASTFVAHSIGSVLWLYTHPAMSSAEWIALIPVVAVERLSFAWGMTALYFIVSSIKAWRASYVISKQNVGKTSL